ncbi:uncharacterized protein DUF4446 [Paenibacillus cellulosilyticus]|uniref:Uncharacterized protein DUF4446 n=1 Tax=Paenibacillus cellulosilyticus TaxID=375489 RepID=A0A2V2Z185_9BACL|nr:DUF4446 family protein [Paenibacillus cellulosilyticus]PWW08834.1 uncharacterized protein DUF4446 [Paenibacillus cellulosilyticus]QKS48383.1 DUF4446 family protein [Paenibacillus cellulosilyticus]
MNEALSPMQVAVVALSVVIVLLIIWMSVIGRRLKKLRKQYVASMDGMGVTNLEEMLIEIRQQLDDQQIKMAEQDKAYEKLEKALSESRGKVAVHRYNAFAENGSDLSFSLAIINDSQDGIVLSGLHSREDTYVYAKPLEKGSSPYTLTPEEKKAVTLASQQA